MLSIASLDAALAVIGEPPAVTYDAARCETCLEYSALTTAAWNAPISRAAWSKAADLARSLRSQERRKPGNDVDIYDRVKMPRKIIGMMRKG
jgi:hypothetical protein